MEIIVNSDPIAHILLLHKHEMPTNFFCTFNLLHFQSTVRPRDCSEIQLLLQLQTDHNKSRKIAKNAKNVTHHNKKAERIGKYTIFPKQNDDPVQVHYFRHAIYKISNILIGYNFQVICDLDPNSDGGGWTIIQRRGTPLLNESERTNFYRGWKDYEQGFGNVDGDYWIGNKTIIRAFGIFCAKI